MDPATAFQLVCGALQLVEFGVGTAKAFHDIYKSKEALTSENERLDQQTQLLRTVSSQISSRLHGFTQTQPTPEKTQLLDLARRCNQAAKNLLERLNKLKVTGPRSKRKVPVQWAKLLLEKGKIEKDQVQLERCRELLDTQMLVNVCRDVDQSNEALVEMRKQIDFNQIQNSDAFKQMSTEFRSTFDSISSRIIDTIVDQSEGTRQLMRDLHVERNDRKDFEQLLESLGFPAMTKRQEEIYDPYPTTFEWMFERQPSPDKPGSDFLDWLETPGGLYWMNGKPGSGKSTLMKFLVEHQDLRTGLEKLAGGELVTMPTFFFWHKGHEDQRSINGLLRSLLYQVLSEHPPFARYIHPIRRRAQEWTFNLLRSTLDSLLGQCESEKVNICLLLDGLDEFEGSGAEQIPLVDLIQDLLKHDKIKAIVSSRPEPLYVDRLSSYKSIRLQDLVERDVFIFVEGQLLKESQMATHKVSEDGGSIDSLHGQCPAERWDSLSFTRLVWKVVDKADGVFLWARLALNSLIKGILARDPIDLLDLRLDNLKGTLDGIFGQLLQGLDEVHRASAANYLLFENQWYSEREGFADLTILDVAFACEAELDKETRDSISREQEGSATQEAVDRCIKKLQDLATSLRARCAGLLDVRSEGLRPSLTPINNTGCSTDSEVPAAESSERPLAEHCLTLQSFTCVRLIHRSAWDFLERDPAGRELLLEASMSTTTAREAIGKVWDGRAFIGLAGMQAGIALADSLAKRFPNEIPEQRREEVEGILEYSHQAFEEFLGLALRFHGQQYYSRIANGFAREFEERREWIASGLEHLSELHNRQPSLKIPIDADNYESYVSVLELTGYMPPQHLCIWLLLIHGEVDFVLRSINENYEASANHLFDATMSQLDSFYERFKPHRILDTPSDEETQGTSIQLIPESFKLIQKLLEIGLDPNARAFAFAAETDITRFYPLSSDATNWQRFLGWLDWLGPQPVRFEGSADIYEQALSLSTQFLVKGADPHASILVLIDPEGFHGVTNSDWNLLIEQSTAHVLNKFMLRTGIVNSTMKQLLEDNEAIKLGKCKKLWGIPDSFRHHTIGTEDGPKRVLRYFTDEQQLKLFELAQSWLEIVITTRPFRSRKGFLGGVSGDRLNEVVKQVWMANLEHISEEDGRQWWI